MVTLKPAEARPESSGISDNAAAAKALPMMAVHEIVEIDDSKV